MPDGFPVTITDDDGGEILVGFGQGAVYVRTSDDGVLLDAGQRERLAQALVAASWETGRVAVSSEPVRPSSCGAVLGGFACTRGHGHTSEHEAYPREGRVLTWTGRP